MEGDQTKEGFNCWAVVEIMGHQRYAGRVSEQPIAGTVLLRIDVPAVGERLPFTKLFGGSAVFSIAPCSEEFARSVVEQCCDRPIEIYSPSVQRGLSFDPEFDGE